MHRLLKTSPISPDKANKNYQPQPVNEKQVAADWLQIKPMNGGLTCPAHCLMPVEACGFAEQ